MPESFIDPCWYRVAGLKPRLRPHARLHRHEYRGLLWYVLQDASTGRLHRFAPTAQAIVRLRDGDRTVQAIWDLACV